MMKATTIVAVTATGVAAVNILGKQQLGEPTAQCKKEIAPGGTHDVTKCVEALGQPSEKGCWACYTNGPKPRWQNFFPTWDQKVCETQQCWLWVSGDGPTPPGPKPDPTTTVAPTPGPRTTTTSTTPHGPTPPGPTPHSDDMILGGWNMCNAVGPSPKAPWEDSWAEEWGINTVMPGKFGDASKNPGKFPKGNLKNVWITPGGENVSTQTYVQDTKDEIAEGNANGIAIDLEGSLQGQESVFDANGALANVAQNNVLVPLGDASQDYYTTNSAANHPNVQYIAPMMYAGTVSYDCDPQDGTKCTQGGTQYGADYYQEMMLKNYLAGWPESKTILTFQSYAAQKTDAARKTAQKVMCNFAKLSQGIAVTINGTTFGGEGKKYAGIAGWPAGCGADAIAKNKANIDYIQSLLAKKDALANVDCAAER